MQWDLPSRCNAARQPLGGNVCGVFVLHYMEQTCRKLFLKEPASSLGWLGSAVWGARVCKLVERMKEEQDKLEAERKTQRLKMKVEEEQKKKVQEMKKKAEVTKVKLEELAAAAHEVIVKIPP